MAVTLVLKLNLGRGGAESLIWRRRWMHVLRGRHLHGGMPQHGHGLPTKPRVSNELGSGTYRLDGMKFSMTGWWVIKLNIQDPQGADTVTFNTVVASPHKI